MAKQVSFAEVTLRVDLSDSLPHETLDYANAKMRYGVCDTVDTDLAAGKNEVAVDSITGTDTVDAWWDKVIQQIKDAEGIA